MTGPIRKLAHQLRSAAADRRGQMTIEWALVLAAVALPMYFVVVLCVNVLVAHFQMVTFLETLPFP